MKKRFIYVATDIMESESRTWRVKSSRSLDCLAELAVYTGCSSGAVCFTSYLQCAQSEIFEAQTVSMLIWLLY